MSASYILLLTAFYVDNGQHLPVRQRLPHLAYWLVPSAVGLPLVARALARHRGLAPYRPTHASAPHRPRPSTSTAASGSYQPVSQDPGKTMAAACWRDGDRCQSYSWLASPSGCRSARRLIAASQLRRIAPLAGPISHQ
jgi:hypothetical protein